MPFLPDLTDPRYLDEVGWFLYHEKYGRSQFGGSYDEERLAYSRLLCDEVLSYCDHEEPWLRDKTVVSIGCGCTGDLAAWPAAVKMLLTHCFIPISSSACSSTMLLALAAR